MTCKDNPVYAIQATDIQVTVDTHCYPTFCLQLMSAVFPCILLNESLFLSLLLSLEKTELII